MSKPAGLTTGRVVHIDDVADRCQAAMVANVFDDTGTINAGGYRKGGTAATWTSVSYRPEADGQYGWHWPEKAD